MSRDKQPANKLMKPVLGFYETELREILVSVLRDLFPQFNPSDLELEHPLDPTHGDWSTNIAMRLAKQQGQNPRELAQKIVDVVESAVSDKAITKIEVAGPGFINFHLHIEAFLSNLQTIVNEGDAYGTSENLHSKRIMVEFAHPNPFKVFHIGHLRNIILGESIVRLLEAQGAEVIRTNYQGDVGMHIAKCLWAFRKIDENDYPGTVQERVDLIGKCYAQGATAFKENETAAKEIREINKHIYAQDDPQITKLWSLGKQWSLDHFQEIYDRVYSDFDRQYMESETLDTCMEHIERAKQKGILKDSDGAVIFDGSDHGLDTRVFLNSEGLPTYEGKELGLAYKEFSDFGEIDQCIHVVAVEQISFFSVLIKVQELLDPDMFMGKQYHLAYEFVGLTSGKMSSRTGNIVKGMDVLDLAHDKIAEVVKDKQFDYEGDTVEQVAIGAVKYSFLRISPFKYLAFDLEASLNFEGDSGPYLQYSYARARSILRSVEKLPDLSGLDISADHLSTLEEQALLRSLVRFEEVVAKSALHYTPNLLVSYLSQLAQEFNSFYRACPVMDAEERVKNSRLLLTAATSQVIKNGLYLLGIESPEQM